MQRRQAQSWDFEERKATVEKVMSERKGSIVITKNEDEHVEW